MIKEWILKYLAPQSELQQPESRPLVFFPRTQAGVLVDEETALKYSAVWSAVRIISETVASLPWHHLKRNGKKIEKIADSNVSSILQKKANPDTCAFTFRETLVAHALLWGNGYAEIERNGKGAIVNMWNIAPNRVQPSRDANGVYGYEIRNKGRETTAIRADKMFHLKGLGFDGLQGYSVIAMAAQSIGLGLATERYGSSFFGNGSIPGGVLSHPGQLSKEAKDNLREAWDRTHKGPNAGKALAVLEEGLTYQSIGIPPDDAQFLETRKFQVSEIARWFRVPPHKIGDLEKATFSNIEHMAIEFVTEAIVPWALRLEQEADAKLLSANRVSGTFTKLNINGLLRGDAQSRFSAYATGRQWGWLSANDVRELEDMNPLPGKDGDMYLVPSNMTTPKKMNEEPKPMPIPPMQPDGQQPPKDDDAEESAPPANKEKISASKSAYKYIFQDALTRIMNRETHRIKDINERVGKSKDKFISAVDAFYAQHAEYIRRELSASVKSLLAACVGDSKNETRDSMIEMVLNFYISKHADESKGEIMAAYDCGENEIWVDELRVDESADYLVDKIIDAGLLAECMK